MSSSTQTISAILCIAVAVSSYYTYTIHEDLTHTLIHNFILFIDYLESATIPLNSTIGFHVLDFMGSLLVCKSYRDTQKYEKHWLETIISCMIHRFGGTTILGVMLGQPPGWTIRHSASLALILAWWLTFFSPYDIFWRILHQFPVVYHVASVFDAISAGHAVTSWGIDKVVFNSYHLPASDIGSSLVLSLTGGVIASNGGGLSVYWLDIHAKRSYTLSRMPLAFTLSREGDTVRANLLRSLLLSCVYYAIINPVNTFPWLISNSKVVGHAVICAIQVAILMRKSFFPDFDLAVLLCSQLLRFINISSTVKQNKSGGLKKK